MKCLVTCHEKVCLTGSLDVDRPRLSNVGAYVVDQRQRQEVVSGFRARWVGIVLASVLDGTIVCQRTLKAWLRPTARFRDCRRLNPILEHLPGDQLDQELQLNGCAQALIQM